MYLILDLVIAVALFLLLSFVFSMMGMIIKYDKKRKP